MRKIEKCIILQPARLIFRTRKGGTLKSKWSWCDFILAFLVSIILLALQGVLLFVIPHQWNPDLWAAISTTLLTIAAGIFPGISAIFSFSCGFALWYGFPLMWVLYFRNGIDDPRVWIAPSISALLCVVGYMIRQGYDHRRRGY